MEPKQNKEWLRVEAVRGEVSKATWSFAVEPGAALWIPLREDSSESWLDWLTGIEPPPFGRVLCEGADWVEMTPQGAAAQRSRIGCVFAGGGLVANLDMDENVWLPSRIHRQKNAAAEIEKWATFFGVWPLPALRAPAVSEAIRRRLAWTRAFAGKPEVLILERALQAISDEERAILLQAVQQVRAQGCAVVFLENGLSAEVRKALAPLVCVAPANV